MKRKFSLRIFCSFFALLLLFLTACSPETPAESQSESGDQAESQSISPADTAVVKPLLDPSMPSDDLFHPETDCQTSWITLNNKKYFTQTDEGIYYAGLQRLYFVDKDTMAPSLVCLYPDCSHKLRAKQCTAAIPVDNPALQYMNGHLYFYNDDMYWDESTGDYLSYSDLVEMDLTGSNRRTILQDSIRLQSKSGIVVHRGSLYIYCVEKEAKTGTTWERVYQCPFFTDGTMRKIWEEECSSEYISTVLSTNLAARGNYLLVRSYLSAPNGGMRIRDQLTTIDLRTGETYTCPSWNGDGSQWFAFSGDRVYVLSQNDSTAKVASFALDFTDQIDYPQMEVEFPAGSRTWDIILAADEQYLYMWQKEAEFLNIFDTNGNLVDSVDLTQYFRPGSLTLHVSPLEQGVVFMTWEGSNSHFEYFKKDEIGTGHIQIGRLAAVCDGEVYEEPLAQWNDYN